jgi:SAM-dependent methyltransferase
MVHEVAAAGFRDPTDYEAARPSYPPDAIDWFVTTMRLGPGKTVCDLAAGTGKFTRLLVRSGAHVVALEPVAGMRAAFRSVLPRVALGAGAAEALPLRDASIDALTVAQAWHWFDAQPAFAEARRALRPGGWLGVVWNVRDRTEPWVNEVWSIMDRVEKHAPWRDHERSRPEEFGNEPGFGPLHHAEFHHRQAITPAGVVQRVASVSHVAVLSEPEKARVLAEVERVLDEHPDCAGREELEIPYRVDCHAVQRVATGRAR